ncbi:HNH endonuclease signature motif containing protein [Cryobacterium sp. TMN-39-2]|uniref:HNH endonuclease signature motif containing protein n=1 Tax=Cryobacterium sp. TMN-39-2 TaxID=1259216 RepID=UPI00141A7B7D|nr:HNH endonuclease signature motif containing protein [Cryobacterium sp. TMN-39-2]
MSTIEDVFTPGPGAPPGPVAGAVVGAVVGAVAGADGSADALAVAVEAVSGLGCCSADYDALSDTQVLTGQRDLARLRNLVETRAVWLAKTLAYRSRPELGQQGLAAQQGFLSPDALIQKVTGATKTDARKLVDVGRMLARTEAAEAEAVAAAEEEAARRLVDGTDEGGEPGEPAETDEPEAAFAGGEPVLLPWYTPISHAIADGTLSVAAAHAIRTGLGDVDTVVTGPALTDAVHTLLGQARTMTVDHLLKRSRRMRDSLDEAGIAVREQKAWDDRYLRVWKLPTGQVCINGLFPPEQGEFIVSTFDSLTSPRRGGVHFVDPARAEWAQSVRDDPRSTDQLTADNFLDLLTAGTKANPHRMLGGRKPAVRILTTLSPTPTPPPGKQVHLQDPADILAPLPDGTGHGYLEGNPAPVSQQTIDRLICDSGTIDITFDPTGQPLDVGREERLFTPAQRIALAARDGGCRWGDCDKPPTLTEAHHIQHWARDHGSTDLRLGILLCNPHHRLLHNQGWQILEHQDQYWLRPPATIDPGQTLIEMPSKNPATQEQHRKQEPTDRT